MATYNNVNYLSQTQQVKKNQADILDIQTDIEDVAVGPQGATGPKGSQGIQGNIGLTGPDGTPVAGLDIDALVDSTNGGYSIIINDVIPTTDKTQRFVFDRQLDGNSGFKIYVDGVLETTRISLLDYFLIRYSTSKNRIMFYDIVGDAVEINFEATSIITINYTTTFSMIEQLNGSTVGPTGPAGVTGPQGATGPTGATGIQGLPGEQSIRFLASYSDLDTFPEYAYRVMITCLGGDYDGYNVIKEAMEEDDTVKFGPYATLVTITDNGGTIQSELENGVTSIRVYAIENLT